MNKNLTYKKKLKKLLKNLISMIPNKNILKMSRNLKKIDLIKHRIKEKLNLISQLTEKMQKILMMQYFAKK